MKLKSVAVIIIWIVMATVASAVRSVAKPKAKAEVVVQVVEEQPIGTRIVRISELMRNVSELRGVRPVRASLGNATHVKLDDDGNWMLVAQRIDRETLCPVPNPVSADHLSLLHASNTFCHLIVHVNVSVHNAADDTNTSANAIIKLRIEVVDVDDNLPRWNVSDGQPVRLEIYEHSPVGSEFFVAKTLDVDTTSTVALQYAVTDDAQTQTVFGVKTVPNRLLPAAQLTDVYFTLLRDLDRELLERFDVSVCVRAAVPSTNRVVESRCTRVNVVLLDINDNPPLIASANVSLEIDEDQPINRTLYRVEATDRDVGVNAELVYRFSPLTRQAQAALFRLDQRGALSLRAPLDYETARSHKLFVEVFDKSQYPNTATAVIHVSVIDTVDEFPDVDFQPWLNVDSVDDAGRQTPNDGRFVRYNSVFLVLTENNRSPLPVADLRVSDADAADQSLLQCSLIEDPNARQLGAMFDFSPLIPGQTIDYTLVLNSSIDRERLSHVQLRVACHDTGWPPRTSVTIVNIRVLDVNDNSPMFDRQNYYVTVDENIDPSKFSLHVAAHDGDAEENGTVRYRIDEVAVRTAQNWSIPALNNSQLVTVLSAGQSPFSVDNSTGRIYLNGQLDRETIETWRLRLVASDGGKPARVASTFVTLHVGDVNDNRPKFASSGYHFRVTENAMIGALVGQVRATDGDTHVNQEVDHFVVQNAPISSSTSTLRFPFSIDERSGWLRVTAPIDREQVGTFRFVVIARDRGSPPLSSTVTVVCDVMDENDNAPIFTAPIDPRATINITRPVLIGAPFTVVHAVDPDADSNGRVIYAIRDVSQIPLRRVDSRDTGDVAGSATVTAATATESVPRQASEEERFSLFTIDLLNGEVVVRREIRPSDNWKHYEIVVEATDQADVPRATNVILHVDLRIDDDVLARGYQIASIEDAASRNRMLLETSASVSVFDNVNFVVVFIVCCVAIFVVMLVALAFARIFCGSSCIDRPTNTRVKRKPNGTLRRSVSRDGSARLDKTASCTATSQLLIGDELKRRSPAECDRLVLIGRRRVSDLLSTSRHEQSIVKSDDDHPVRVAEVHEPRILAAVEDYDDSDSRPRLRSFNPDRRTRPKAPLHAMCESLSEYYFQLRRSTADSVAFRDAACNTTSARHSRCTLCKSNTIGEFSQLQRSFNEPSTRGADKPSPRSCDNSPRSSRIRCGTRTHSPAGRGLHDDPLGHKTLRLSSSYCDEYRPGHLNGRQFDLDEPFSIVQVHGNDRASKPPTPSTDIAVTIATVDRAISPGNLLALAKGNTVGGTETVV